MKTPIIALDVDDVLLDVVTPWLEKYNALSGDCLDRDDLREWHWPMLPGWSEFDKGELRTPDLYAQAEPLTGAQGGVELLLALGYRIVAVSCDFRTHSAAKATAVHRYFPGLRDIVFAKNKRSALGYDLLVDDGLHNDPEVLFSQPWNLSGQPRCLRANNWEEVIDAVDCLIT